MSGPGGAGHKALHFYSVLLKLYPLAYRRAFSAQMRQTFLDHYLDILTQGGRAGIQFWLGVVGDEALSILREHISALSRKLDDMDKHKSHLRQWGIGIGIALVFVIAFIMRPGVLKVSLAISALAVLTSIPVLLIASGFARVKHQRTPLGAMSARWHVPVGIVFGGPDENRELLGRCHAATAPGGRIVIQDFILEPDRTAPKSAVLFALNMLVGTSAGNTYTEAEYASWLEAAGYAEAKRVRLPGPSSLVVARRAWPEWMIRLSEKPAR